MSQNMTPDDGTDEKTSVVDVRTTDLSEFENGEAIRVHYRDDPTSPSKTVTGRVEVHYTDEKAMIETEDDRRLIVDLGDTASDGGLRDFDTSETVGRPMFAETAYHPEKDGQDLKEELLGEDDDEDDDEETPHVLRYENSVHGADENGNAYTTTTTVEVRGKATETSYGYLFEGVECEDDAGGTGLFRVEEGVVYVLDEEGKNDYECGVEATVEEVEN